jgi:hypothetical protein
MCLCDLAFLHSCGGHAVQPSDQTGARIYIKFNTITTIITVIIFTQHLAKDIQIVIARILTCGWSAHDVGVVWYRDYCICAYAHMHMAAQAPPFTRDQHNVTLTSGFLGT